MAVHLEPFDPARPLVAQKPFRFEGHAYTRGLPFPAEGQIRPDDRKLRKLYEARFVVHADSSVGSKLLVSPTNDTPTVAEVVRPRRTRVEAPRPRRRAHPLDHDQNGQKGGSKPEQGGDEATRVKRLEGRHNHAELFAKASGIAGIKKSMTKKQLATALVRHNRDE